ncbi:hypothetical protein GCM10025867_27290 [Frondihabitans sucicola]|uniref:Peptidoglycan binding-like domain-containing protein n=1 Tax=Frondihabitans sucicola TaxID=1268041 RepID=A0ABN6XZV9_9MICO|nr:hypothetical protein GCM10025867_27290 [Frondihabitans sucicola]
MAPPTPGPLTAKVERGDLSDVVSFRGTVRRDEVTTILLPVPDADEAVVTRVTAAAGATISAGSVLTEINGRPVFALPGGFRFYRSLGMGDTGPDVRQLQQGLAAAGAPVTADGIFGATTESAVKALYVKAGYAPPPEQNADAAADADTSTDASTPDDSPRPDPAPTTILPKGELAALGTLPAYAASTPPVGTLVTSETTIGLQRGTPRVVAEVPTLSAEKLAVGTTGTFRSTGTESLDVAVEKVTPAAPRRRTPP